MGIVCIGKILVPQPIILDPANPIRQLKRLHNTVGKHSDALLQGSTAMIVGATTHTDQLPSRRIEQPDACLGMQTHKNAQRDRSGCNLRTQGQHNWCRHARPGRPCKQRTHDCGGECEQVDMREAGMVARTRGLCHPASKQVGKGWNVCVCTGGMHRSRKKPHQRNASVANCRHAQRTKCG